ncbi:MAG: MoxR family ATPase [Oligoflexia bacterium]|nr:MoxR family ATPase [Oligoflexia bacterium]
MQDREIISNLTTKVVTQIGETVLGQAKVSELLFGALLIGGHVLLEGPPGVAKTLLARCFAETLGLSFRRIQFTPDLMPSDITGVNVFDRESSTFRFAPGPLFADIVLADEINRTPPKTQAALLEAMEEHRVTVDGKPYELGELFTVVATQNPIEMEGTFPLPEAQLDRFLFKLQISYPDKTAEQQMLERFSSEPQLRSLQPSPERSPGRAGLQLSDLLEARAALRRVRLAPAISDYVLRLVSATRTHGALELGASPRAGLGLALAAKLSAALERRDFVIPDDVKKVARPVLLHRLIPKSDLYDSADGVESVLDQLLKTTPVPSKVEG